MKNLFLMILTFSLPLMAQAAGGGGHASVLDLKWPFVNFVVLFVFLIWKIKKPMAEMFAQNAKDVKQLYEVAEEKDKEAQIKLDMYQKKMNQVESDCSRILDDSKVEADSFAKRKDRETAELIAKIAKDAEARVETEKKQMIREINRSLVEEVISKTKSAIKGNKQNQSKATERLLSEIR